MVKSGVLLIILTASASLFPNIAVARSCNEQGALCKQWARANVPDAARAQAAQGICASEVPKCIARCKRGEKYFTGIGGSTQYPIDTCK